MTDKQGNPVNATYEFEPFSAETSEGRTDNGSGSYTFRYYPITGELEPGEFVINYSITDNLSGEKVEVVKDIMIADGSLSNRNDNATTLLQENFTESQSNNGSVHP